VNVTATRFSTQARTWILIAGLSALLIAIGGRFLGGAGRYRDSGMMGTPANQKPRAFWNADLEEAAAHAVAVVREVRPQVVVTYDPDSTRHPDHVHAARAATSAVDAGHVVAKLYYKAHGSSYWQRLNRALAEVGIQRAAPSGETLRETARDTTTGMSTPEDDLFTGL